MPASEPPPSEVLSVSCVICCKTMRLISIDPATESTIDARTDTEASLLHLTNGSLGLGISKRRDRSTRSPISIPSLGTSIYNGVQRTGSNSLRRPCCQLGLQHGRAQDTARSFFAGCESRYSRSGRHSTSSVSSGQQMTLTVWAGA